MPRAFYLGLSKANLKIKIMDLAIFKAAIDLAFEAGKWEGQVELEEHFDREQYSTAMIESIFSKKMAMPFHNESKGRTVEINLRSQKWRDGVREDASKYKERALGLILAKIKSKEKLKETPLNVKFLT